MRPSDWISATTTLCGKNGGNHLLPLCLARPPYTHAILRPRDPCGGAAPARGAGHLSAIDTMGAEAYQPIFLGFLGEAYDLGGRVEGALELAGRSLTLAVSVVNAAARRGPFASSARSPPAV